MTEREAMLRAVCLDPADDLPRLVFADWLDEHDEPERGEFIRDCCQVMGCHTDCPTRIRDLTSGRPVPLRCGVCEYCAARRRAARFCGRHPWVEGVPYAVAFEPTPLDGGVWTGPGLTITVSRGFISRVYCPLADFLDLAGSIFCSHPIEAVTLTDAEPLNNGGYPDDSTPATGWFWLRADAHLPPIRLAWELPPELHDLVGWNDFPSEDAAIHALSAACVAWGRRVGGLPPLTRA